MMRRILDLPPFVILIGMMAIAMWLPAIHAAATDDEGTAQAFFYSGMIFLVLTGMIALSTTKDQPRNDVRSQLIALLGVYLVLPLMATLPVMQAVPDTSFGNVWFEMVSCFTTTGATVYDIAGRLPPSVHFWRALVGWMGGFFVLLTAIAILAPMNLGGVEVLSGRVPGRGVAGAHQVTRIAEPAARILRYATILGPAYGGLTVILWIGLMMLGNAPLMALSQAMGTVSTSGVTVSEGDFVVQGGFWAELLIFAFLCMAVTRRSMPGLGLVDRAVRISADPEVRLAVLLVAGVSMALFLRHWLTAFEASAQMDFRAAFQSFWGGVFTTLSYLTTTGYQSQDWDTAQVWSGLGTPGLILMGLAIIGGGVATTAGGVKLLRVYALFRHGERELERLVHPSSIGGKGAAARRLREEGAYVAWIFFILFAVTIAIVMMALSLVEQPFEAAMILAVSALTTTGALAETAGVQPILYGELDGAAQAILAVTMVIGRLETLAILALFAPDGWRR
jgi:trk system potassium uptake protein